MYSNYNANYRTPVQQPWYPPAPKQQTTCLSILAEPTHLEKRTLERNRQPRYMPSHDEPGYRRRPHSPYGQGCHGYYSPPSVNTSPVAGWQLVQQQGTSNVRSEMMSDWEMVGTEV